MSASGRKQVSQKCRSGGIGPHDDLRWAAHKACQRYEEQEAELAAVREEHFAGIASGRPDDCDRIAHPHLLAILRHRHG